MTRPPGLLARWVPRLSIGGAMLGIAALGLFLGMTKEALLIVRLERDVSILGCIGIAFYGAFLLVVIPYVLAFAIPHALISLLLRRFPGLRPGEDDLL